MGKGKLVRLTVAGMGAALVLAVLGGTMVRQPRAYAQGSGSTGASSGGGDEQSLQERAHIVDALRLAREQLGAAYAGAVIDDQSRTLHLYSTQPLADATRSGIDAITGRLFTVRAVQVQRSLQQLESVQRLIDELAVSTEGQAINGTYLKVDTNQVHVDLVPGAATDFLARVTSMAPAGAIEVGHGAARFQAG